MTAPRLSRAVAFVFAATILAGGPCRARDVSPEESDQAFHIFLDAEEELVQRSIYKPTGVTVLSGALQALERELDPEFAPYFPQQLDADFKKAWDQFQKALIKLAAQPELDGRTLQSLVEQALRGYVRRLDRYSDYDDLASYNLELKLKAPPYVGVGMTIERTPEGFDLFPFSTGPADLAGCIPGDRLIAVDDKPVRGLGKAQGGALFAGPEHSAVRVMVRHVRDGKEETLTMKREKIVASPISVEQTASGAVVRLRRFTPDAVRDLRRFLHTVKDGAPLTLDLRGCQGGELQAAVDIAELFLPAGEIICRVETRAGSERFQSHNSRPFRAAPLRILQDRGTMSGAEILTVALVTSPAARAQSRGERSYGKGVTLSVTLVAHGGGRMIFADGRIYGPHGEDWDGEGLAPAVEEPPPR